MTRYLNAKGIRIFDYPQFAMELRDRVRDCAVSLGAKPTVARQVAANSRRWWRNSGMLLNAVLTPEWADGLGMPRLS
jgi:hypothetical protein